MTAAFAPTQHL